MPKIKAIRTEADHAAALARIDELMDAELNTPEGEELDLLTDLVEVYESKVLEFGSPSPIEALKFRMEQGKLTLRDLVPLIGSRAKVSEVMSGKRDITMQMARALHGHLGIPAEVLLRRNATAVPEEDACQDILWDRFPIKTLRTLRWIDPGRPGDTSETLLAPLAKAGGGAQRCARYFRKTRMSRANAKSDPYALIAWCWRVRSLAHKEKLKGKYREGSIGRDFFRELAKLSLQEDAPLRAKQFLSKHGIVLVIVPHLPRTYLDGAAMKLDDGRPVIALTLRYDRVDNFWFCLFHELAHVAKHLDTDDESFFDDLSLEASDDKEAEADDLAGNGLIPNEKWEEFESRRDFSPHAVLRFATKLNIHPAIVAGRIRHEEKNFRLLSQFVGTGEIRQHFPEYNRVA